MKVFRAPRDSVVLPLLLFLVLSACYVAARIASATHRPPGTALNAAQRATLTAALALMQSRGLTEYSQLGAKLEATGKWRAALPSDKYLAGAEKAGDTPFAYTLPDDKHPKRPIAIVLAPRFFTDATQTAQAATMVHELAHWQAFVKSGESTEYDGYKAEFDTHKQLGLGEKDGLTYFMMLDGVVEYVVPKERSYALEPEVMGYIKSSYAQ